MIGGELGCLTGTHAASPKARSVTARHAPATRMRFGRVTGLPSSRCPLPPHGDPGTVRPGRHQVNDCAATSCGPGAFLARPTFLAVRDLGPDDFLAGRVFAAVVRRFAPVVRFFAVDFLAVAFVAPAFFGVDFFAVFAVFFAGAFFLAGAFLLSGAFLLVGAFFLAGSFFLAGAFLVVFLAAVFLPVAFRVLDAAATTGTVGTSDGANGGAPAVSAGVGGSPGTPTGIRCAARHPAIVSAPRP